MTIKVGKKMEAIKHVICQKCNTLYSVSMGDMSQEDYDDYINDGDRLETPYLVRECEYCCIDTLNYEVGWQLLEPEIS